MGHPEVNRGPKEPYLTFPWRVACRRAPPFPSLIPSLMKRLLLLALALPIAASAQNVAEEASALPVTTTFRMPTRSAAIDCANGDFVQHDVADAAFGVGNTGAPVPSPGSPRELGQSVFAPCAGRADSLFIIYQPREAGTSPSGGEPGTTVSGNVTFYEGAGTTGTLLSTTPFSFLVGAAGFAYFQGIDLVDAPVLENGEYTFFVDFTVGNSFLQGTTTDTFKDGTMIQSLGTGPTGATVRADRDLRFALVFARPGVATEAGPAGARLSISASSPNPVRTASTISFSTEAPVDARVAVYDVLGREVAVLADGAFTSGSHSLRFDASALAPGAYVVRLTTDRATVSRTVSVVR